jgi:hypothetical protein
VTANTPQSRKAKGRAFQQEIRDDITEVLGLPEEDVISTSMGAQGVDIKLSNGARARFPFGIEAKRQEKWNIPEWWGQACENARKEKDLKPLLVMRKNHGETVVMMRWADFLDMAKTIKTRDFDRFRNLAAGITGEGRP